MATRRSAPLHHRSSIFNVLVYLGVSLATLLASMAEADPNDPVASAFCFPVSPVRIPATSADLIDCNYPPPTTGESPSPYYHLDFNPFLAETWFDPSGNVCAGPGVPNCSVRYHLGEDWNGSGGGNTDFDEPVYSVAAGTVVYVKVNQVAGDRWGKVVMIRHTLPSSQEVYTLYAHLNQVLAPPSCTFTNSPASCEVAYGTQIGTIGTGGGIYPAHLHFELRLEKRPPLNDQDFHATNNPYVAADNDPKVTNYSNPRIFIETEREYGTPLFSVVPPLTTGWNRIRRQFRHSGFQLADVLHAWSEDEEEARTSSEAVSNGWLSASAWEWIAGTLNQYSITENNPEPPQSSYWLYSFEGPGEITALRDGRAWQKFNANESIRVTHGPVAVRDPDSNEVIGSKPTGAEGLIVGGPIHSSDAFVRWTIDFGDIIGNVVQNWIEVVPSTETPPPFCPAGFHWSPGFGGCSPGNEPAVTTEPANNVADKSAQLNMTVNPGGLPTTAWFIWQEGGGPWVETPSVNVGSGTSTLPISATLGSLDCETTYSFKAAAENSAGGPIEGSVLSFTTTSCTPGGGGTDDLMVNGDFESGNTGWTRVGNFHIDDQNCPYEGDWYAFLAQPDGTPGDFLFGWIVQEVTIPSNATEAELSFRYSISTNDPRTTPQDVMSISILDEQGDPLELVDTVSNLDAQNGCGSSFYDRITHDLAHRAGETIQVQFLATTDSTPNTATVFRVDDVSLEIVEPQGGPPSVTTEIADQITNTSARLNMTVNPNGLETDVWFDFEANDSTPDPDTEHLIVGSGTSTVPVSITVHGLDCDTLYFFEANAENSAGDDDGSTNQFTTDDCEGGPPVADTDPADQITSTSARLTAEILPNGLPTDAWFEWGTTTDLGNSTPQVAAGSGTSPEPFDHTLTGLSCGTRYYFEAHAENSAGEDDGVTLSFLTDDCDPPPPSSDVLLWAGLQACSGDNPAVLLGWIMPDTADPIVTVRRTDGQYVANVDTSSAAGNHHIVPSGLVPGNSYSFTVEVVDDGETVVSNQAPVQICSHECSLAVSTGDLPHRPRSLVGMPFCDNGVVKVPVSWTTVGGASHYRLDRFEPDIPAITTFDNLTGTSFLDQGLTPGTVPTYSLKAVNASGERESLSLSVAIPLEICSDPGNPGPLTAEASAPTCDGAGEGEVTVTWTPSAGAEDIYNIKVLDNGWHYRSSNVNAPVTNFEKTFADLRPGSVQTFVVRAESESTPNQFRQATPLHILIPRDICGQPTLLPTVFPRDATYVEETQAFLEAAVDPEGSPTIVHFDFGIDTGYGFTTPQRSIGSGYRSIAVGEVPPLPCGTVHHFRVAATNDNGTTLGPDRTFTTDPCSNQPPQANNDTYALDEDNVLTVLPQNGVLANDIDPDGDPLEAQLVEDVTSGVLSFSTDGSFTYTPAPDHFGDVTFTYAAFDGAVASAPATATLSILPVNDAPSIQIVQPDGVNDLADESFLIEWLDEDVDDDASIELGYSLGADCITTTSIVAGISEDDPNDSYLWDTAEIPADSYYILAEIDDGSILESHCNGPVVIDHTGIIFADGFESGDVSAWSSSTINPPPIQFPGRFVRGVAYDAGVLWVIHSAQGVSDIVRITKLDAVTRAVLLQTGDLPWNGRGVTVGAGSIWIVDALADVIRELDPTTLDELSSFSTPGGNTTGIAFDGVDLWIVDPFGEQIYRLSTGGVVLDSFSVPNEYRWALQWEGAGMWTTTGDVELSHYLPDGTIDDVRTLQDLPTGTQVLFVAIGDGKAYLSAGELVHIQQW